MSRVWNVLVGALLLLPLTAGIPAAAQPAETADEGPGEGELREALRHHFESRLRVELGLTDEQSEQVLPKVGRLEQERRRFMRERMRLGRELRRAYREGASDARLQELLDGLTGIEADSQRTEREIQREIDASLTVRQRVQLRFFVARFRQELNRRLQESRHGPRDGGPRRPGFDGPPRRRGR